MFTARAFWIARRSAGLASGLVPPVRTAIAISLPMRWNCFAMRSQRANMVCLRTSKMRPMRFPDSSRDDAAGDRGSYRQQRSEQSSATRIPVATRAGRGALGPADTIPALHERGMSLREPVTSPDRIAALLARYVEHHVVRGERMSPEALCAEAPELLSELRSQIDEYHRLQSVLGPPDTSAGTLP